MKENIKKHLLLAVLTLATGIIGYYVFGYKATFFDVIIIYLLLHLNTEKVDVVIHAKSVTVTGPFKTHRNEERLN